MTYVIRLAQNAHYETLLSDGAAAAIEILRLLLELLRVVSTS